MRTSPSGQTFTRSWAITLDFVALDTAPSCRDSQEQLHEDLALMLLSVALKRPDSLPDARSPEDPVRNY